MSQTLYLSQFVQVMEKDGYEFVNNPRAEGVVLIVPVTKNNEIVLIEQYRKPVQSLVIEYPAGLVGDEEGLKGESFEKAARRELLEETGYEAKKWTRFLEGPSSPGSFTEVVTFFMATEAQKVEEGGGDEYERIIVHTIPLDRVMEWLKEKEEEKVMIDPRIYTGLFFVKRDFFNPD